MFDNYFIIKDFTTDIMSPSLIVKPRTKGKTFILKNQEITPNDIIEVEEIKPGNIFLSRIILKVKVDGINIENVETKYQESELGFATISSNITSALLNVLPKGTGAFYQFLIMTQTVDTTSIVFTRNTSLIWSEKIVMM